MLFCRNLSSVAGATFFCFFLYSCLVRNQQQFNARNACGSYQLIDSVFRKRIVKQKVFLCFVFFFLSLILLYIFAAGPVGKRQTQTQTGCHAVALHRAPSALSGTSTRARQMCFVIVYFVFELLLAGRHIFWVLQSCSLRLAFF